MSASVYNSDSDESLCSAFDNESPGSDFEGELAGSPFSVKMDSDEGEKQRMKIFI